MESARAMLSHSNLPNKFWAEAVATAAYLRNRTTTSANEDQLTPYEKWYEHKPDIGHIRVFGCAAYSHVPSTERRKLDKKAQKLCFIGYSKNPKGYRLIDVSTEKVVTRRDVVFNETDFRFFIRETECQSPMNCCQTMRNVKVNLSHRKSKITTSSSASSLLWVQ